MNLTGKQVVYISGRNAQMNRSVSIFDGNILINIPNYTQVYKDVPVPIHRDEFCYALVVKDNNIVELNEGNGPILRVWEGPRESRQYPQYGIQAAIFAIKTPFDGGKTSGEQIKVALDQAAMLRDKLEQAGKDLNKVHEQKAQILSQNDELNAALRAAQNTMSGLRAQISDISQHGAPRTVLGLATLLSESSDEIVKEMPYIGDSNVGYLKEWATRKIAESRSEGTESSDEG